MALRFTGDFAALQERLNCLLGQGAWSALNDNQKQFRHHNGGILNWYTSTGTINFQGPPDGKAALESLVGKAMAGGSQVAESPPPAISPVGGPPKGAMRPEPPTRVEATQLSVPAYLGQKFADSEIVIGLVGAVGTELTQVIEILRDRLRVFNYDPQEVRVSKDIIPQVVELPEIPQGDEFARISGLMDAGNRARSETGDNSILALGIAAKISAARPKDEKGQPTPQSRRAYIISSLKHPEEVARLREIYPEGFYLIGVHADEKRRHDQLVKSLRLSEEQASSLMIRDEDEHVKHGQRTSDTFHLSDFFVRIDGNQDKLRNSLWRILDIQFGYPYATPTFDEYAMFMAFSAALRSADLSRQVGAVVARENEIIATGANDCPKHGGGLYWPEYDNKSHEIKDAKDGRDYMRGEDKNKIEQQRIIEDILLRAGEAVTDPDKLRTALEESRLADITEYGRMVHAEMEALLSLARNNVSSRGATLYCTTFPCHNCAKHIVAAGITQVVYIEPYPKSKAAEFHSDSVRLGFAADASTVLFEPFVGVGPRRFFDLFSMRLGSGYPLKRKDDAGQVVSWKQEGSRLRIQMLPCSYVELELIASSLFNKGRKAKEDAHEKSNSD
jgi:deoxycytidylate deaminase